MAETQTPIERLRRLINLAELVHHPDSDTELTADARVALEDVEALAKELSDLLPKIAVYEALSGRCFTCGADEHHAHPPTCSMVKARTVLAKFQVKS